MLKKNVTAILIILIALLLVAAVIWIYNQKIAALNKRYGYQSEKELKQSDRPPMMNQEACSI